MQIAIQPNTVYTFKLNSGEELIAKVIQAGGDFIVMEASSHEVHALHLDA